MFNDQEENALAYYLNGAKRLTNSWLYNYTSRLTACNEAHCKAEFIYDKLNSIFDSSVEIKDEKLGTSERIMTDIPGADLSQTKAVTDISKGTIGLNAATEIDALGTDLKAKSNESDSIVARTSRRSQEIAELVKRVREENKMQIDSADLLDPRRNVSPGCSTSNGGCKLDEARESGVAGKDGKELNASRHESVIDDSRLFKGNAGVYHYLLHLFSRL